MHETIALHAAYLRRRGFSDTTITAAVSCLNRVDRQLRLGITQTNRNELELYLQGPLDDQGHAKWRPQTREVYFFHLAKYYSWATDEDVDLLSANPMYRMEKPKRAQRGRPRPLSNREVEVILAKAVNPFRLAAIIALETGLRCCEIAHLRKEDVGDEDVYILKAKGGASATVPGRPLVLLDTIRDFPDGNLVETAGGVADAGWISRRSATYFQRTLGLPGVSLHRARHTYAKRLRDAGCDAFVIKRNLRHASLTSTEIYVGATDDECRQAVRGLPTLLSNPESC